MSVEDEVSNSRAPEERNVYRKTGDTKMSTCPCQIFLKVFSLGWVVLTLSRLQRTKGKAYISFKAANIRDSGLHQSNQDKT